MSSLTAFGRTCTYTRKRKSEINTAASRPIATLPLYEFEDSLNCGKLTRLIAYLRGTAGTAKISAITYPPATLAAAELNCGKLKKLLAYLRQ